MFKRDQKYDLKQAKDDFNLWDGVHGRDVLKHLEQFAKWEPGKKERERREKLALQALIEAEQERENGDGLGGTNLVSLFLYSITIFNYWDNYDNFQSIFLFLVVSDIAEEGDDAFAAMRRAKAKSSLKGKGRKIVEVPREDMQYGLEKVQIGMKL